MEASLEKGILSVRVPIKEKLAPSGSGNVLSVVDSGDNTMDIVVDGKLYVRVYRCVEDRQNDDQNADLQAGPRMVEPEAVVAKQEETMSTLHALYSEFWTSLKERTEARTRLFNDCPVPRTEYYAWGIGENGIGFYYIITRRGSRVLPQHDSRVEVYIGTNRKQENKRIYRSFLSRKDRIESAFRGQLVWQELPHRDVSRVFYPFSLGTLYDQEKWAKIQDAMIDGMIRLYQAFRPEIDNLP